MELSQVTGITITELLLPTVTKVRLTILLFHLLQVEEAIHSLILVAFNFLDETFKVCWPVWTPYFTKK